MYILNTFTKIYTFNFIDQKCYILIYCIYVRVLHEPITVCTAGQVSNFLIKDNICDRTRVTLYYLSMVLTMLASMIGTARTELTTVATAVDGDTATAEEAVETSSSGTIGRGGQVLWPTARVLKARWRIQLKGKVLLLQDKFCG